MARRKRKVTAPDELERAIAERDLQKKEAADRIGISPAELSQFLGGLRVPTLVKAARISDLFDVDMRSWVP